MLPYLRHGDDYLVVGSNFGGDHPPHWLLNLEADPKVRVQVRRRVFDATAEAVFPGSETYEGLWRIVTRSGHRGPYERYQKQTSRPIPVVRIFERSGPQV